eukprot:10903783-Alexandrium_andersonii.AAC.1
MVVATWSKAAAKWQARSQTLASSVLSAGRRSRSWNYHVASLAPYPALTFLPVRSDEAKMDRALSTAFHLGGWAPGMAITALGPAFGLKGSPRGLAEASQAAGTMAWIRGHGWGPAQAREEQRRTWSDLRRAGIADPLNGFRS